MMSSREFIVSPAAGVVKTGDNGECSTRPPSCFRNDTRRRGRQGSSQQLPRSLYDPFKEPVISWGVLLWWSP
jgi:hypothetical protein